MSDNVIYLSRFIEAKESNTVFDILSSFVKDYDSILENFNVDVQDPTIAFDIATIRYLMHGMAHRSQGQTHPSQIILNSMREKMLGY